MPLSNKEMTTKIMSVLGGNAVSHKPATFCVAIKQIGRVNTLLMKDGHTWQACTGDINPDKAMQFKNKQALQAYMQLKNIRGVLSLSFSN